MYVTPTSELATAVRENLRRAVLDKKSCWEFNEIEPSTDRGYYTSFKILDKNNILMYAYRHFNVYKLNRLNGPAFYHINGNKKMFFINNEAYPEFDYNRHYAVKFIKNLQLRNTDQPIVGPGVYRLANSGMLEINVNISGGTSLKLYNSAGRLHNENGPAVVDFAFYNEISYFRDGKLHNSKGPAVIKNAKTPGSTVEKFYIGGKQLTPNEFKQFAKNYDSDDIDLYSDLTGI